MAVRVLDYRGDGTYYLLDGAHELDGLRPGPAARLHCSADGGSAPNVVGALLAEPVANGVRALDVIVAAPKPVSVLLATEPPEAARRVVELHSDGVDAVLAYLAEEGGRDGEPLGLRAVGFTHGINRLGDPHLHTHVLVGARDRAGAPIAASRLRARASTADALYLAALRRGLPAATGRDAWVGRSGATCVEGVPYEALAATTTPRGRTGRWERGATKLHPSRDEAQATWAARLAVSRSGALPVAPPRSPSIDERRFGSSLGQGLVSAHDVLRSWASACTRGATPTEAREAAATLRSGRNSADRCPAVVVRDDRGVRLLGPRPTDLGALGAWHHGRGAIDRYLAGGHALSHLVDPAGAPAATWLAVAAFDASLDAAMVGRIAGRRQARDVALDRSVS